MRTGINHLFIPGPTNVPECVRQAMNVPMQDQRAHDFGAGNLGLFSDLKKVMRTTAGTAMIFYMAISAMTSCSAARVTMNYMAM